VKNISLAIAVSIFVFFSIIGVALGTRMEQSTVNVLLGIVIGVLVAFPCGIAVGYAIRSAKRQREYEDDRVAADPRMGQQFSTMNQYLSPAQIAQLVASQYGPSAAVSPYQLTSQNPFPSLEPQQRNFTVIGENGESRQI